jgi:hypothetical protein
LCDNILGSCHINPKYCQLLINNWIRFRAGPADARQEPDPEPVGAMADAEKRYEAMGLL